MTVIGTKPQISDVVFLKVMDIIADAQSVETLSLWRQNLVSYTAISFHHLPAIGSFEYDRKGRYWTDGLSEDIKTYFDSFNDKPDPVMELILSKGCPYWLSELHEIEALSDKANIRRINSAIKYTVDGLALPLFGPYHKRGYIFISFGKKREFFDATFKWKLHALLQAWHVKYCIITNNLHTSISLTTRESEVLELITFGKTNPEIGKILGISTSTVAGYVRQIFLKLDVSDRVTAALRARSFNYHS